MKLLKISCILTLFLGQNAVGQDSNTSPSNYAIAYSFNSDIHLSDADGNSKIKITNYDGGNGYSAWSPDGKRIAFYSKYDDRKTWSIHTMNADGTNRKRLTDLQYAWDNSPTWSPDGTRIAFARAYKDSEDVRQFEIWIMNADGTDQRKINGLSGGGPYFTPNGKIVFHSQPGPSDIYIANSDGSSLTQLTQNDTEDWHPEISSDGKRIAFMSNRDGNHEIYVMNADGSDEKRLTFNEVDDWYPSWSPDGTQLIFKSNTDEEGQICKMNSDGSSIQPIISGGSQAAWLKTSHSQFNFPPLEGPYMGQTPPGMVAEPFAPGIISTKGWEVEGVFAPGMNEFYFTTSPKEHFQATIIGFRKENNIWRKYTEFRRRGETAFSPDGSRMLMAKGYKDRKGEGWSERKSLDSSFQEIQIMRLTASFKGTYVLDEVGMPNGDGIIRYSRLVNGQREVPRAFGKEINTGRMNAHPFIAPDESYLIWDGEREEGFGDSDLYISFRQQDGSWGPAINMGEAVNTDKWEAYASVTSDGKYMLFNRGVDPDNDNTDIYWVDTKIIENLRPNHISQNDTPSLYTIAYGSNGICLTNTEGTSMKRLTNGNHGYPAWSPDGKRLAFYGYHDEKRTWSIHTVNSDGTNKKRLTHAKYKLDNMPVWSPDGTKIVFAREYWDSTDVRQYELWIMNADGSEERQLKALSGGGPRFLPDGRLLFHSEYKDKESEITIADIEGKNVIHLTDNEAEEWDPKLSPDGKHIVFSSNRDGNHEIYIMNIDGSDQKRLTNNDVDDYGPTWSPDGSQILFQSKGGGVSEEDPTNLYIMNKDGSSIRKVISNGWQPAWFVSKEMKR